MIPRQLWVRNIRWVAPDGSAKNIQRISRDNQRLLLESGMQPVARPFILMDGVYTDLSIVFSIECPATKKTIHMRVSPGAHPIRWRLSEHACLNKESNMTLLYRSIYLPAQDIPTSVSSMATTCIHIPPECVLYFSRFTI